MTATTPDKLLITPLKVSVHRKGDNPIFGENVINVSVEDEGGGPFIVLDSNEGKEDGLRIDMDELEAATSAARKLLAGVDNTSREAR
jgi:hypothetical protein